MRYYFPPIILVELRNLLSQMWERFSTTHNSEDQKKKGTLESNYSTAILFLELYTLEKFLHMCTKGCVRMFTADCFLIEKQNSIFIKRRMNALWSICTYYTSKKSMPCSHIQQHRWV